MDLYEHQAKAIFQQYGIPIPRGLVVRDESSLEAAFSAIGQDSFGVVKAQVLAGGRGKAGGIKVVDSLPQALEAFQNMLRMRIKGLPVDMVLVEERLNIKNEYFISITIDPEASLPVLLLSPRGGMDIEEVATEFPSALGKHVMESSEGLPSFAVMELARGLGFPAELWGELIDIAGKLYKVFCEEEATLAEVNPLVETVPGRLIAADGRLSVDDNALFRHPGLSELKKEFKEMSLKDKGLDYIDLGTGDAGLLCVGAGMTMLTMDLVAQAGARARCFLDVSHGISAEGLSAALELLASDPEIKYVLVNMFGGLSRMDEIATFMLQGIKTMRGQFPKPMVIRFQGTNAEGGRRLMMEAGYDVYTELEEVMDKFGELLKGAK